jgi:hypothetical protein
MAPPCWRAALLCGGLPIPHPRALEHSCPRQVASSAERRWRPQVGKSRSIRRFPRKRVARGARLSLAKLSQALGYCIAQFVFVLGVQTPNVVSLRDDVHDSHIRFALKCHEEIAPVEQGQGADLFVASIAVSEKRNVRMYLHHRVPFLNPPTVMRSGAYCSLEATFAMVNFAQASCSDSLFPNLMAMSHREPWPLRSPFRISPSYFRAPNLSATASLRNGFEWGLS